MSLYQKIPQSRKTPWLFNNQPITNIDQLPNYDKLFGFIYRITNLDTGEIYIGKKQFYNKRKKNLAKKDLSTDKRKKTYTYTVKESDWLGYWSSSDRLKVDVKLGTYRFKREIIALSKGEKYLTFLELEYQIRHDVLRVPSYNDNIMGRYYRKDMMDKLI